MYFAFYYTVLLYDNALTLNWRQQEYFWLILYMSVHIGAIYFFLTAGQNPGYVQPDNEQNQDENENLKTSDGSIEDKDLELGTINKESTNEENKEEHEFLGGVELRKNKPTPTSLEFIREFKCP